VRNFGRQVSFGGNKAKNHIIIRLLFDLTQPVSYVFKTCLACAVVAKYDRLSSFKVGLRYCAEAFLTSRVPDLQLDSFVFNFNGLHFKINAC
jgi:hypothetical protein